MFWKYDGIGDAYALMVNGEAVARVGYDKIYDEFYWEVCSENGRNISNGWERFLDFAQKSAEKAVENSGLL